MELHLLIEEHQPLIDIGEAAFRECDSLEKPVKLPASPTHIDEYVFSYGGALKVTVNVESVAWKLSKQNKMRDGAPPTRKLLVYFVGRRYNIMIS